jgi:hypothetical protein
MSRPTSNARGCLIGLGLALICWAMLWWTGQLLLTTLFP